MLAISYMGTKRPLAPLVAELATDCQSGACLDLFSGMCAVGQQLSPKRHIWSNDLQSFASLVAKCQFCSIDDAPDPRSVEILIGDAFRQHMFFLEAECASELLVERESIEKIGRAHV